jgi:hypothetical protein
MCAWGGGWRKTPLAKLLHSGIQLEKFSSMGWVASFGTGSYQPSRVLVVPTEADPYGMRMTPHPHEIKKIKFLGLTLWTESQHTLACNIIILRDGV